MRVIPPKYYEGKIPDGYEKKQFFRFDQNDSETFGVLYSGERVNVNFFNEPDKRVWSTVKKLFRRIWT